MDNNIYKSMADEKIASFDYTYSSNHIRMLKILLHHIPESYRRNLTIYIKYMELQHAFNTSESLSSNYTNHAAESSTFSSEPTDFTSLIRELLPFCNSREKQQFQNIENMVNNFEQIKSMMEMFEMMKDMKDMFGDGEGGFDPGMLAGMMNMNDLNMDGFDFSNLNNMFSGKN